MNRVRLGAWYFIALGIALMPSKLSTQVSGSPSSQEIDALRAQVKRLQQCWYVAQDEPCFWGLVTAASHMRRPENRYETGRYELLWSGKAPEDTLNTSTRALKPIKSICYDHLLVRALFSEP